MTALAPKHKGGEWEEYHEAHQEVLHLERQLAAAKAEEYAEPCDFPLRWDAGAPMPHLMVNDNRALLAFFLSEPDPNWDGTYVTIKSLGDVRARSPLGTSLNSSSAFPPGWERQTTRFSGDTR